MKPLKAFLSLTAFSILFFYGVELSRRLMPIESLEILYLEWWFEAQKGLVSTLLIVFGLSIIPVGYSINLLLVAPLRRWLRKKALNDQWDIEEEAMRERRQRKGY